MLREPRREIDLKPGIGQLTLAEHSLCPLDPRTSLVENLVHRVEYEFSDANRKRRQAQVRVFCPLGLSANDELYLWGLLALTMSQPQVDGELRATPHWCLRRLGLIDQHSRRGGRQYRQFIDAVRRLSTVSYLCDFFFDPVRAEHRQVSFRFLSYSLPCDPDSSRMWRIVWDPVFFEIVRAASGHFRFDLRKYRELDTATRRLFLLICKVCNRSRTLPHWDLERLAVDLLGFSSTLAIPDMKKKVGTCLRRLQELGVIGSAEYSKIAPRRYRLAVTRGPYFNGPRRDRPPTPDVEDCPVLESLIQLGFEVGPAKNLIRRFPLRNVEEWADITQAALERFGKQHFRKSPMAFLVDGVSKRTPPDWWYELRKKETKAKDLGQESQRVFNRVRRELFGSCGHEIQSRSDGGAMMSSAAGLLKGE